VLRLHAEPASARQARDWAADASAAAGAGGAARRVVRLLTSELVHNAVVHGPAHGAITVSTRSSRTAIRVLVTDDGPDPPRLAVDGPGWGLRLVNALASRWGVEPAGAGKTVWFEVPLDLADPG